MSKAIVPMPHVLSRPIQAPSVPANSSRRSELWQRLRIARDLSGLTQAELADKMNVSRPAVTFWENKNAHNRTQMSAEQMQRYCAIVGISMGLLMDDTLSQADFQQLAARDRLSEPEPRVVRMPNAQATGLAFFAAVRFGVMAANPDLAAGFDYEVSAGGISLIASFVVPGHVVQFVIQQQSAVEDGDRLQIVKETGHLLMLERALTVAAGRGAPKNPRKHMILYTSTAKYSLHGLADFETAFGVELFIGGDVAATVKYLLDMV